jgi:hypothetical protein
VPETAERRFAIAVNNHAALVLTAPLAAVATAEAPGVLLDFVPSGMVDLADRLDRGELDLAIGGAAAPGMLPFAPPASPQVVMGPGKQKTPLRALAKSLIVLGETGAGEGIRTLDPNLGNPIRALSPQNVFLRQSTKKCYVSKTYVDRPAAGGTLEKPLISSQLLPPCFPAHAAPAWGSKSACARPPPLIQSTDFKLEIRMKGELGCRN